MPKFTLSRRQLIASAAFVLVATLGLPALARAASASPSLTNEQIIRQWYAAWEHNDVATFDALLADTFTFSSAAGDDHISKTTFKKQCWDTQVAFIDHTDLERIVTGPDDAFVMYLGHTRNGKTFHNVEYFRFKDGKIVSLECYFGAAANFPSAVSKNSK
jgi:ketosteroid isomerase-like protein